MLKIPKIVKKKSSNTNAEMVKLFSLAFLHFFFKENELYE